MNQAQKTETIEISELFSRCAALRFSNWRLVQLGCTAIATGVEINYTFDKDYEFLNLRISLAPGQPVASIQSLYECAFIYENEIAELFDVTITDMAVDFKGQFYKTAVPAPFAPQQAQQKAGD